MNDYLILFAIVLGVNLIPAFGPPTWTILVLYSLNTRMPTPAVVLTGATPPPRSGDIFLRLGSGFSGTGFRPEAATTSMPQKS